MHRRNDHESNTPEPTDEQPPGWPGSDALSRSLDGWQVPGADPSFRSRLRSAFVSGDFDALGAPRTLAGDGPMEADDPGRIAELEAELAPHLDRLDVPPASAAFADGLREAFVSAPGGAPLEHPAPREIPSAARRLSLRWRLLGGGLLAAAAAWLAFLRPTAPTVDPDSTGATGDLVADAGQDAPRIAAARPTWSAVSGSFTDTDELTVDGRSLAGLSPDEVEERLSEAREIATGETAAQFLLGEYFVLELDANSRVELVANDARVDDGSTGGPSEGPSGGARSFRLRNDRGALRIATGPAFPGSRMTVAAPFLEVDVVGTVFGIDVFDGRATCLCCSEGVVDVRPLEGNQPTQRIEAGHSSLVGPGFAEKKAIENSHAGPLEDLALFWE